MLRHHPLIGTVVLLDRTWAHSGIRPLTTSESGPLGASRSPSDAQNRVLSVFGVYSVFGPRWSVLVA